MMKSILGPTAAPLLPERVSTFIKRRAREALGLTFVAIALAWAATLLSYDSLDPSLNNATERLAANLFGPWGSVSADAALQTLGLAAATPILAVLCWGILIFRHRPVGRPSLRLALLLTATLFCVVGSAGLPTTVLPWLVGGGGTAGLMLLGTLNDTLSPIAGMDLTPWLALTAGIIGLGLLAWSLGFRRDQWVYGTKMVFFFARLGTHHTITTGQRAYAVARAVEWPQQNPLRLLDRDAPNSLEIAPPPLARARPTIKAAPKAPARKAADEKLVETAAPRLKASRKAEAQRQVKLDLGDGSDYILPPLALLEPHVADTGGTLSKEALEQNAKMLASVLEDFGIHGDIVKVRPGPVITMYELEPAPGTKTSRVIGLADDIARSMSAISVRVAVVPGHNVIGIELPNARREMVQLRELLESEDIEKSTGALTLALGKDISGAPMLVDLARMPHLLIAGTTGSGKSVAVNTMILSLLYRLRPDECKFIMIDPKMLELSVYDGIPHLLSPVVTEPGKAVVALKWAVREMEDRYRAMSQMGVRNINGYNQRLRDATKKGEELSRRVQTGFDEDGKPIFEDQPLDMNPLPFIVVVIDEMADLMMVAGKDVEAAVQRLAQMARAAGIHLVMATQRPSVDVITGTIKANFPTRISFQVTSKIDSRTILGEQGAEQLLGQGDMLYMAGGGRISRVHGPFCSDEEVETVVKHLKSQGQPAYIEAVTVDVEPSDGGFGGESKAPGDELFDQAVALVAREGKASTSFIQRHLQIGYNRAARIIEQMEEQGMVSKADRVGRREVLLPGGDDYAA